MENTACGNDCPFVKQGFCANCRECPNYIETWWIPPDSAQPIKLEDCSPKRMVLQQQILQARFDLVMQALVESRNENSRLNSTFGHFIEMSKKLVEENKKLEGAKNEKFILSCNDPVESDSN